MTAFFRLLLGKLMKKASGFSINLLAVLCEKAFKYIVKQIKLYLLRDKSEKKQVKEEKAQKKYEEALKDGVTEYDQIKSTEDFLNGRDS